MCIKIENNLIYRVFRRTTHVRNIGLWRFQLAISLSQRAIHTAAEPKAVSWRAVMAGLLLIVASDYYINWSTVILSASKNNKALFPMGLFFPFVVLVAINLLLERANPQWALNRCELCVSLGMGLIGSLFPFYGLASYVVGSIAAPYYFATPENGWAELLHPNMVSWLVMNDEDSAVTWFYDGLPAGQGIPWRAWVVPVFWWMTFVGAAACVALCLMVVLRKQWVENERLEFPLMEVGLQVARIGEGEAGKPPLLAQRIFRMGFWIGIFAVGWNIISFFYPLMPGLPTTHTEGAWFLWLEGAKPFWVQISIYVMGFAYFARVETLFSFWLFFLFTEAEVATFDRLGIAAGHGGGEAVRSQNFGVLCAYVVFGLWMARAHLKAAVRKVFTGASDVDDAREAMSYRAAAIALVAALLYMVAWLHAAGMEIRVAALYLFFTAVAYIGMARFAAELGLPYGDIAYHSITWTPFHIMGGQTATASTLTCQGYLWAMFGKTRGFLGPPIAQMLKLTTPFRIERGRLFGAIVLAVVAGATFAVLHAISMGYSSGGFNLRAAWNLLIGPQRSYDMSITWIRNPEPPDVERMLFMGSGVLITAVLTYLKYRFVRLPLHPVALMLQGTYMAQKTVFSVFLTWAYKSIVLKVGGARLYKKGQPFFIGLLIGYAAATFLSCVVDSLFFFGRGHLVHGF